MAKIRSIFTLGIVVLGIGNIALLFQNLDNIQKGVKVFNTRHSNATLQFANFRTKASIVPLLFQNLDNIQKGFKVFNTRHSNATLQFANFSTKAKSREIKKILILTYMRSGSSFAADSLRHSSEDVFYSFEPLNYILQSYITTGLVCNMRNNICSKPDWRIKWTDNVVTILKNIFECKFRSLSDTILYTFPYFNHLSHSLEGIDGCFPLRHKITGKTKSRKAAHSRSKCLSILETKCHKSTVRIIKSLRVSFLLAKDILEQIEDIKIIHLIRDPRAVIQSRREVGYRIPNATQLCMRMSRDIDMVHLVSALYPDRVYPIRYECLAQHTTPVLRKLYKDMSLEYGSQTDRWIQSHTNTSAQNRARGFGVHKFNSTERASRWRLNMSFTEVKEIDAVCSEVYERIGVRVFKSDKQLANSGISELYTTSYTARYCT